MSEPTLPNPGEAAPSSGRPERRRHGRRPCTPRPILHLLVRPSFSSLRALVDNASAGGMGLVLPRQLEPGSVVALQLRQAPHGVSGILSARVIHVTPLPGGGWVVGCQLSRPLLKGEEL